MKSNYAQGTSVTVEKSQQEIASMLRKYGASDFAAGWSDGRPYVIFKADELMFRLEVPEPDWEQFKTTETGRRRKLDQIESKTESERMRRWRILVLLVKAKLESVAIGNTTMFEEFLSDVVLPSREKMSNFLLPQVKQIYVTGQMPDQLLALPSPRED
jgi:hypothetical protein